MISNIRNNRPLQAITHCLCRDNGCAIGQVSSGVYDCRRASNINQIREFSSDVELSRGISNLPVKLVSCMSELCGSSRPQLILTTGASWALCARWPPPMKEELVSKTLAPSANQPGSPLDHLRRKALASPTINSFCASQRGNFKFKIIFLESHFQWRMSLLKHLDATTTTTPSLPLPVWTCSQLARWISNSSSYKQTAIRFWLCL